MEEDVPKKEPDVNKSDFLSALYRAHSHVMTVVFWRFIRRLD